MRIIAISAVSGALVASALVATPIITTVPVRSVASATPIAPPSVFRGDYRPTPAPTPTTVPQPPPVPVVASVPARSVPVAVEVPKPRPPVSAAAAGTHQPPAAGSDALWLCIAQHESGGNWQANTGNRYFGGIQFSSATWRAMGTGYARADLAPVSVQIAAGKKAAAMGGLHNQFPSSSRACGA